MSLLHGVGSGLGGAGDSGGALGSFYGHTIDQSLRFNRGDTPKLVLDPTGSPTAVMKCTISVWVKLCEVGTQGTVFSGETGSVGYDMLQINTDGYVRVLTQTPTSYGMRTAARLRDPASWYHLVIECDSSLGSDADRLKIYINGDLQTLSSVYGYWPGNHNWYWSRSGASQNIGTSEYNGNSFGGYLAEFHFIDGEALDPTSFGETKDGVWIPKEYSGSHGNNGFYLPFSHDKASEGFTPVLYEGTRVADTMVKGVGFTPDLVWVKRRDDVQEGSITDSVRGTNRQLRPAADNAESSYSNAVTSFDADGFTLGVDTSSGTQSYNYYQDSHVAWCWEAGGAPTATNSAGAGATPTAGSVKIDGSNLGSALSGTIPATKLTANTSKGFSIVGWTGTGSAGTIAHGLNGAPELIIVKNRDDGSKGWPTQVTALGNNYLELDVASSTFTGSTYFNDTAPTSSVFSVGTAGSTNASGDDFIAYCWDSISGYSSIGTYTGSGSSGKAVTGLGFRPLFVMIKRTDSSGGWHVFDSVRFPSNPITKRLEWDNAEAENSDATVDIQFDSDGFTLLTSFDNMNASSGEYIFMAFADTRDSAFYKDNSGNLNNFTPNNIFTHDVVPDSPTNNFATMNPIYHSSSQAALLEGNLKVDGAGFVNAANGYGAVSTFAIPKDKKIYIEVECTDANGSNWFAGFASQSGLESGPSGTNVGGSNAITVYNRQVYVNGTETDYGGSYGLGGLGSSVSRLQAGDILGCMCDGATGKVWFSRNGTYFMSPSSDNSGTTGDPAGGNHEIGTITNGTTEDVFFVIGAGTPADDIFVNFGQDSQNVATASADGEGIGTFEYAPPTGYVALCASNLTTPDIGPTQSQQADDNFNTVLWTGNGTDGRTITGVNFAADWVWVKSRSVARSHHLQDVVRGFNDGTKVLRSNEAKAESEVPSDQYGFVGTINSDGYTLEDGTDGSQPNIFVNNNTETYVAWNWKAGGSASSNSDGSITSSVSANTAAGFSIVSWTGTGSAGTIGHGLSSAPEHIIVKNRDSTAGRIWLNYVKAAASDAETDYLSLNGTGAAVDNADIWNDTAPTSTVFSVGSNASANESSDKMIAYCFHSVEGYSDFGSYVGNNSTDGPFVFTGFRPAWILWKRSDGGTNGWFLMDSKRDTENVANTFLRPNAADAEATAANSIADFLSNGFKLRGTGGDVNTSGATYIYLAFAEAPFKFANAR